ncbi:MAG: hypothetical protein GTN81_04885 [Proteobacteria bacterium]|nr:hypothetical protein [Pseudomonadota bacterium]
MLAARRILEEKHSYRPLLTERVDVMVSRMAKNPVLSAESYPDESWVFCNTVALAAVRMADYLDGSDHSDFFSVLGKHGEGEAGRLEDWAVDFRLRRGRNSVSVWVRSGGLNHLDGESHVADRRSGIC